MTTGNTDDSNEKTKLPCDNDSSHETSKIAATASIQTIETTTTTPLLNINSSLSHEDTTIAVGSVATTVNKTTTTTVKKKEATEDDDDENEKRRRYLEIQKRLHRAMWRDAFFLILGGIALQIISYVETHAADANIRGWSSSSTSISDDAASLTISTTTNGLQIVDAGFVLTEPLQRYLAEHRRLNDLLAFLNSLLLILPSIYVAKVTVWNGDYTVSFRILMTQLFRSFCGWFTYLPPDPSFLMSYYDFPEVAQCLFVDCSNKDPSEQEILPFVSFFSGHVATVVIVANHMYINGYVKQCLALHVLNVLQIIRLLATRGHYSIDIIIGWCVAVYVSSPAERLGRYYSRGIPIQDLLPNDAKSVFENVTGIRSVKRSQRYSVLAEESFVVRQLQQLDDSNGTSKSKHHGHVVNDNNNDHDNGNIHKHTEHFTTTSTTMDGDNNSNIDGPGTTMTRASSYGSYEVVQSETTAKIVAEIAKEFVDQHQDALKEDLRRMGLKMKQLQDLRRDDLMKLRALAELKLEQLRDEAIRVRTTMGMTTTIPWNDANAGDDDDGSDNDGEEDGGDDNHNTNTTSAGTTSHTRMLSRADLLSSFIQPIREAFAMEETSTILE